MVISNHLHDAQDSVVLSNNFPQDKFGLQLETVSKVIASHECRGSDRCVLIYYDTLKLLLLLKRIYYANLETISLFIFIIMLNLETKLLFDNPNHRDVFYVETGNYDAHADVISGLEREFESLNNGLNSFVNEMKNLPGNVWEDVVLVFSSDFGRTLSANSGGGTDHGWSGNAMIFGGSIEGKRILGQYPDDLTSNSPLDIGKKIKNIS